jgi:hypothetical protein
VTREVIRFLDKVWVGKHRITGFESHVATSDDAGCAILSWLPHSVVISRGHQNGRAYGPRRER